MNTKEGRIIIMLIRKLEIKKRHTILSDLEINMLNKYYQIVKRKADKYKKNKKYHNFKD